MRKHNYNKSLYIFLSVLLFIALIPSNVLANNTITMNENALTRENGSKISAENCIIPNDHNDYFNFEIDIKNEDGVKEGKIYKEERIRDEYYLKTEYKNIKYYSISENGEESLIYPRTEADALAEKFAFNSTPIHLRIRGEGRISYNLKQDGKGIQVSGKHYYNEEEKSFFGMKVESSGVAEIFHIPVRGKNTNYKPINPTKPEVEYPEILDTEPWDEGLFTITADGSGVRINGIDDSHPKYEEYKQRKTLVIPKRIIYNKIEKDVVSFGHDTKSLFQNKGFKFNQIIWPDTIKEIKSNSFSGYENELYLSLPKNLTKLGVSSFSGIKNLKGNLELPNTLTTIEPYVFSGCENLESKLIIPKAVTTIGDGAFQNCYKLYGDLEIPASVKTIGFRVFQNCTGFDGALVLNEGLEEVKGSAFAFENSTVRTWVGNYSSDIRIPSTLKTIGSSSFSPGTNYDKYRYNISLVFFGKGQLANTNIANDQQLSIATYNDDFKNLGDDLRARYRNFIEISPPSYEYEKEGVPPIEMDKKEVSIGEELETTIPICISEPTYDRRMEGSLDINLLNENLRYGGILDDEFEENPIGVKFYDIDKEEYFILDYSIKNDVVTLNIKQNTPIHFNIILNGALHEIDAKKEHQGEYEIFATVSNVINVKDNIVDDYTIIKSKTVDVMPASYTVAYDANTPEGTTIKGTVPTDNTEYKKYSTVTVKGNEGNLYAAGYEFAGWNTNADGSGISYKPEETFTINGNITLYAKWNKLDEEKPEEEDKDKDYNMDFLVWGWNDEVPEKTYLHRAYINGYPDGSVRPQGEITRGEVAAIVARLHADVEEINYGIETDYSDVNATDWYAKHISYVSDKGLMEGYEDGTFKPEAKITRAEYATVIARFQKLEQVETSFEDSKNHWANGYIGSVYNNGWITGYPDGTFKPTENISREEVATMTNKMLDRSVDGEGLGDLDINKFVDLEFETWSYYEIVEASNTHEYVRRSDHEMVENWKKIVK